MPPIPPTRSSLNKSIFFVFCFDYLKEFCLGKRNVSANVIAKNDSTNESAKNERICATVTKNVPPPLPPKPMVC